MVSIQVTLHGVFLHLPSGGSVYFLRSSRGGSPTVTRLTMRETAQGNLSRQNQGNAQQMRVGRGQECPRVTSVRKSGTGGFQVKKCPVKGYRYRADSL